MSHLAGKLDHISNNSCWYHPNLCAFFDLVRMHVNLPAYPFSKQSDKNSNCKTTSKVAFCTLPATSGGGWAEHPNFEMPYLAQFFTVSNHTYTVRKVFVRPFPSSKNKEKRSLFEIVINEIHKTACWVTYFNPAIQNLTQRYPKLGILLLDTFQADSQALTTGSVSGWCKRAKPAPLCFTTTVSHIHDAF